MQDLKTVVTRSKDGTILGGQLSARQLEALKSVSPTADDILANTDALNAELIESYPDFVKPVESGDTLGEEQEDNNMSLDKELEDLEKEITAAKTTKEQAAHEAAAASAQRAIEDQIRSLLSNLPSAPSEKQIEAWKREYGEDAVHVTAFDERNVYIYKPLTRGQWQKIQGLVSKMRGTDLEEKMEQTLMEKVVQYSILWPKLDERFFFNSRAGVVQSLYEAILVQSYFLTPAQTLALTIQL